MQQEFRRPFATPIATGESAMNALSDSTPADVLLRPSRISMIGNFPPRRCGISTFTADLRAALLTAHPGMQCAVIAMTDPGASYRYPIDVGYEIQQDIRSDYLAAAEHINATNPDIVSLQHEYGIFGGRAGELLLPLVKRLRAPVVTTFHTVLAELSPEQRKSFSGIVEMSSRIVVMAEYGREVLVDRLGVPDAKVQVIPHGIPDVPFLDPAFHKDEYGLDRRTVILTFGLLSRNKGIEMMIEALPTVVKAEPNVIYVVLGATHPGQIAHEGESYRDELAALAKRLGVAEHVRFVNEFVEQQVMLDYLTSADIYVTPYRSADQVTSGTLAYSAGLGKAVVSTPYWHARELLADGRGELVPFGDSQALAKTLCALLADDARRHALRRRAYAEGRKMIWPAVAERYLDLFAAVRNGDAASPSVVVPLRVPDLIPPRPSLAAVARMTDSCGILQHSISSIPDRAHGYCLDDNARALLLMHDYERAGVVDPRLDEFIPVYASFVASAWNPDLGRFRNFQHFDRRWLEDVGSEDSFGRALWAIGATAARSQEHSIKLWATCLADRVLANAGEISSPRACAFMTLGIVEYLRVYPGHRRAKDCLRQMTDHLHRLIRTRPPGDWLWFEPMLTYDNARLPEALLRAGQYWDDDDIIDDALRSLRWLMDVQTTPAGHFRPAGTDSYGQHYSRPKPFDQQPVDVWASIAACEAAYDFTGDRHWIAEVNRTFAWFRGANDLGIRVAAPGGGCFDGLQVDRVNLNQGAESILAYQFSICAYLRLQQAAVRQAPQATADA
jgi:glycosyltransferase involved in cell wall biosynthesis